ncbi:unnamed protein product [Parajaminaea phylloscopi]
MKYLLQAIEARRQCVKLSDPELTKLLTDVQRARDDRSLLLDALERLLLDLRSQAHASAFLTRVNKRDAPDYYDVIKNPMDLGLMLKNVKSGKYRTKEAFRRDLDLIWDNCLLYNTEPSHPLRISANLMRKRSHDLLSYIQDSHDVKSALTEWVATHTSLTAAEAKALQKGELLAPAVTSIHPTPSATLPSSEPTAPSPVLSGRAAEKQAVKGKATRSEADETFENRRALLPASGARIAEAATRQRRRGERDDMALRAILGEDWDASTPSDGYQAGESSKSVQPIFEAQDEETEVEEIVLSLSAGRSTNILAGPKATIGPDYEEASQSSRRIEVMLPRLASSATRIQAELQEASDLSNGVEGYGGSSSATDPSSSKRRRGVDIMKKNISTLKRMKRLKDKFDVLETCLENESPLPSGILADTDDEDDENTAPGKPNGDGYWRRPRPALPADVIAPSGASPSLHPFPHLSRGEARARLAERIGLLIGNVGFEATHTRPVDILNSVAEEFLLSLGRTLRLYIDRYGNSMSSEEILLHTLHSTSSMQAADLDRYVYDDTSRYQNRLQDLREKLEASWKERVAIGEERLMTEEDARFFGEESEDLVAGNLPSALDDDFFGFKAMGLDQELGMSNMQVPLRLLQRRGLGHRRAGEAGLGRKDESKDPFPPPRPFVRMSEAAVPIQIGLLRSYYTELIHRRGHHRNRGGEEGDKPREEDRDQDGDEGEDGWDDDILTLSDEEQERTSRYKVPPNGKMPRRDFWTASGGKKAPATVAATAAGASKGAHAGVNGTSHEGKAATATTGRTTATTSARGRKRAKKD